MARKKGQARGDLEPKRRDKQLALDAEQRVADTVLAKEHALGLARRARAHDRALLARSKRDEQRIQRQIRAEIAREQRRGGGYRGQTGGLLMRPV